MCWAESVRGPLRGCSRHGRWAVAQPTPPQPLAVGPANLGCGNGQALPADKAGCCVAQTGPSNNPATKPSLSIPLHAAIHMESAWEPYPGGYPAHYSHYRKRVRGIIDASHRVQVPPCHHHMTRHAHRPPARDRQCDHRSSRLQLPTNYRPVILYSMYRSGG